MKQWTSIICLTALFILATGCMKTESTDPPEVKDPLGMYTYSYKPNGIVQFNNISENATSYFWEFGDQETSTSSSATIEHQYLQNGVYIATITAYGNGKSSSANATLNITTVIGNVPTVETNLITNITLESATGGGNVTADGGSAVTARGICWSTSQNPTVSDNKTMDGSGTGNFTSSLTGLIANTPYYARAYATNSSGTGYGNEVSFNTSSTGHYIGESFGGGIVFYVDGRGNHGLIAATSDQTGGSREWGCWGYYITGADGTAIGTGYQNTTDIILGCSNPLTAASICRGYDGGGFNDWFLPSKDELDQMYQQKAIIGGFSLIYYWSSTEISGGGAWSQAFDSGTQSNSNKASRWAVRAIRAF